MLAIGIICASCLQGQITTTLLRCFFQQCCIGSLRHHCVYQAEHVQSCSLCHICTVPGLHKRPIHSRKKSRSKTPACQNNEKTKRHRTKKSVPKTKSHLQPHACRNARVVMCSRKHTKKADEVCCIFRFLRAPRSTFHLPLSLLVVRKY